MNKPLIVITGASSGFGAEIAKIFNQAGYPELLLGRRVEKIQALPLNFENVMIESVDVTNQAQFKTAIDHAEAKFGPVDLLFNNAGVMLLGNVTTQSPTEWQTMLDTNVMGVLNGNTGITQKVIMITVDLMKNTFNILLIGIFLFDDRIAKPYKQSINNNI